jgi:hypothetical protein
MATDITGSRPCWKLNRIFVDGGIDPIKQPGLVQTIEVIVQIGIRSDW